MDKEKFKINFDNKNYAYCIDTLQDEIVNKLSNKIKQKYNSYTYFDTKSLYEKSRTSLPTNYQLMSYEMYYLNKQNEKDIYTLTEMLDIYKML